MWRFNDSQPPPGTPSRRITFGSGGLRKSRCGARSGSRKKFFLKIKTERNFVRYSLWEARNPTVKIRYMGELKRITVNISDMKASADKDALLITHSLGSCIGLVGYDPRVTAGALLHFQLPDSSNHGRRAQENPFMFADTGIPLLLQALQSLGGEKNRMVFGMFGGSNMLDDDELFKIGTKNARATKKILWQNSISLKYEDVGGNASRTLSLEVGTGRVALRKNGKLYNL